MSIQYEMPSGEYWIGDPGYCFPHDGLLENKWGELLEEFNDDGFSILDNGKIKVWAVATTFGDGLYFSNYRDKFSVDSGLIGIITQESIDYLNREDADLNLLGKFVKFNTSFIVKEENGKFWFGDIIIDTNF